MSRFTIARSAQKDIDEICEYVYGRSPAGAKRFLDDFFATCRLLATQPKMGEPRDDLCEGIRVFSMRPYVVCYRIKPSRVQIAHVIHGSRDFERVLREKGRG